MRSYTIAREGLPYIMVFLVIAAACCRWNPFWSTVPLGLALFCVFFFRNPFRYVPEQEGAVVSPADGVVMDISEVYDDIYLNGSAIKISIFLSLFNVHINRIPIDGEVEYVSRVKGKYLPAFCPQASAYNSRNLVGIRSPWGRVLVVQITGIVARRIVCKAAVGSQYRTGDVFGMIKFGSCTEIYLPPDTALYVAVGDKVKGGETIIANVNAAEKVEGVPVFS